MNEWFKYKDKYILIKNGCYAIIEHNNISNMTKLLIKDREENVRDGYVQRQQDLVEEKLIAEKRLNKIC